MNKITKRWYDENLKNKKSIPVIVPSPSQIRATKRRLKIASKGDTRNGTSNK